MDLTERQALTNCWIFFKENVCDVNSILDYFIQAGVNCEDVEEITVEPTRSKRKQAFLMRVPKWGSDAFRVLVKALNNTGCNHVSDRLMEELECVRQKCLCTRNTIPSWLSPQVGRITVSEHALHLLAQELSPSVFYLLGTRLGFSHPRLEQFKANDPHTVSLQFSNMMCEWRSTEGSQAVIESLVAALSEAKVEESLYQDILLADIGVLKGENLKQMNIMNNICMSISDREQWV